MTYNILIGRIKMHKHQDDCEVNLSYWLLQAIESNQVVTISNDYFRLRRPLERRLYEIAQKHCYNKPKWLIELTALRNKTGSNAPSNGSCTL